MRLGAITHAERRRLGRFDTPWPLAQALADWAVRDARETVLEPSCGGGVIIKSVITRLAEVGAEHPASGVWGCDIDPRALAETLRCVAPEEPKLVLGDFLGLSAASFGGAKFNAILGNPPYVRLHTMDALTREIAREALPAAELLDGKASLWAYFPIHAFKMLADGGRMGWILPESILHAEYGKQILGWAKRRFERCIAVSLRERCFVANGAEERVVILLLSGAGGRASRDIEMIEFATAKECIEALPQLAHPDCPDLPQLNGHVVPHLVSNLAVEAARIMQSCVELKNLGHFAEVKIGVVTGDNGFFLLSEEQRCLARLRSCHFQRVTGKFVDLGNGFHFTGEDPRKIPGTELKRSWLLCPNPRSLDRRLAQYLGTYSPEDIANNRTMGKRAHWQVPDLGGAPDAFFQYMGKGGPRLVLNEAGYFCTNTIHRIFFTPGLSKADRRAICLSLHSCYSQLSAEFEGRQYGSGVLKLEPSEARRLRLAYNEPLARALSKAWSDLSKRAAVSGWKDVIPQIDKIVAAHCPVLAKSLPVEQVNLLLIKVRQRRNSAHLGIGK